MTDWWHKPTVGECSKVNQKRKGKMKKRVAHEREGEKWKRAKREEAERTTD